LVLGDFVAAPGTEEQMRPDRSGFGGVNGVESERSEQADQLLVAQV
jgi:hypothetical protein